MYVASFLQYTGGQNLKSGKGWEWGKPRVHSGSVGIS